VRPLDCQEASLAEVYRPLRRDQDPAAERADRGGLGERYAGTAAIRGCRLTAMKELEVPKELQPVKAGSDG
jgi:hypothetical protein